MTTLAEFLLARITEDETRARTRTDHAQWAQTELQDPRLLGHRVPGWHEWPEVIADAARVLVDCEAKRLIVEAHPHTDQCVFYGGRKKRRPDPFLGCETCHDWDGATEPLGWCVTLCALALPYVDHPDFRPEWRVLLDA